MSFRSASNWFVKNAKSFSGELKPAELLSRHTYYRIGGPADLLVIPKNLEDLRWLAIGIHETQIPIFILGAGSNLLVADSGFPGLVIKTSRINLEMQSSTDGTKVRAGASLVISTLLRKAAQMGWGGLEFLTGIPGSVGGAVAMNAGTHLGESQNNLLAVEFFPLFEKDAKLLRFEGEKLQFEYRKNLFLPQGAIVWAADWCICLRAPERVKAEIDRTLARRKATQPIDFPSCGSVFKNPRETGLHAWQVIDRLGLKGHQIGSAQFSEKHGNFILNLGNATASDVRRLIDLAKARALKELGIQLEEEVKYLGF